MQIFRSKRNGYYPYYILGIVLFEVLLWFIPAKPISDLRWFAALCLIPVIIHCWIYFNTYYTIDGVMLKYKSAFLSGEIEIGKIRSIEKGKTMWSGVKPATATKGLIIYYNRWDEIYMSPESNEAMIEALKEVNPGIDVLGK